MAVKFIEKNHQYISTNERNIDWTSVTSLISALKEPFNATEMAKKSSQKKNSKWFGMTEQEILTAWENESKRSTDLGTWFHNQREKDLTSHSFITKEGIDLPIIKPIWDGEEKIAPNQKLTNGIYPEHFIYMESVGLCGQSDYVEVINDVVNISDYKSNKEIKTKGFTNWEGISKKLKSPMNHLDDCHLIHYTLQLSLYMYMILKHNPNLKPGKLNILHIKFEEQDFDKYGYPIYKLDVDKNFIVKEIVNIELPYMKKECMQLIDYLKNNKSKLNFKK